MGGLVSLTPASLLLIPPLAAARRLSVRARGGPSAIGDSASALE